jgi:uncharacterized protein (TIGR03437 family)
MFATSLGSVRPNICSLILVCFGAATLTAAPQLRLSTTAVGPIYVESGASAAAQTVNAFNIGDGSLNLSVTSSASWLSATLGSSQNCSGGPVTTCIPVNIKVTTSNLAIGSYTESLTVNDPNAVDSPQNITVTVQVDGAPTSVNLYVTPTGGPSPTASAPVNTGGSVKSAITTSDNGPWLTFALAGGGSYNFFTPYQVTATAQPGQSGSYTGKVTLTGSPNSVDNQAINVNLQVTSQPIISTAQLTYNLVQGQGQQINTATFQNLGLGTLAITGVNASGGSWLTAAVASPTSVAITVDTGALSAGSYMGSITLTSNAANTSVAVPVRVNIAASTGPILSFGGVVDNAAFATGQAVGSGTIIAVFGSQLASGPTYASTIPLPTTLAGIQILVNGTAVPLFYVDAYQADIQVPFGLTAGSMTVQAVRNGQPGNQISASVDSVAPRLFALRSLPAAPDSSPYGIVINSSDGTLALPSNLGVPAHPAHPGDVVTIYALGLGPVTPSVSTGTGAPASPPLAQTINPVQVYFGGGFITPTQATPQYAGLAPNFVGLYQINVAIPADAPLGNIPVMINMPGHVSNFIEMAIAAAPSM